MIRPRLRIPIWAALAIVGAAYVGRSVFLRQGDFGLDVRDVIVLAIALAAIGATAWFRSVRAKAEGGPDVDPPSVDDASRSSES